MDLPFSAPTNTPSVQVLRVPGQDAVDITFGPHDSVPARTIRLDKLQWIALARAINPDRF